MGTEPEPKDIEKREGITNAREGVTYADLPLAIRPNGTVTYDGIAIGGLALDLEAEGDRLTLNLGWMRAAGLHVTIEGDPRVDRQRGGTVLER